MARAKSKSEPVVVVFGASGMLGRAVVAELTPKHPLLTPSHADFDVLTGDLGELFQAHRVLAVVNCVAYTNVDRAESEPQLARDLNQFWPKKLGAWATLKHVPMVHISTDFVFDGQATTPYPPNAETNPQGTYAKTKEAGERYAMHGYLLRTSWLFGTTGHCFPRSMVRAWLSDRPLRVVDDQRGTPTFAPDVAKWIGQLLQKRPPFGTFHASGSEVVTWYDFARQTLQVYREVHGLDRDTEVTPIRTSDWPAPAPRPAYSALDSSLTYAQLGPPTALDEALRQFAIANPPEIVLGP